ncbi:SH3 domain-containing protein [Thermoproteota archaeon]
MKRSHPTLLKLLKILEKSGLGLLGWVKEIFLTHPFWKRRWFWLSLGSLFLITLLAILFLVFLAFAPPRIQAVINKVPYLRDLGATMIHMKADYICRLQEKEAEIWVPVSSKALKVGKINRTQWEGPSGLFVLVSKDNVIVRSRPSETATIKAQLSKTNRVRVLFVSVSETEDQDEYWAFVASEDGERLLGWVLEEDLAYPNDFGPAEDWVIPKFSFRKGEYFASYSITASGRFKGKWFSKGKGLFLEGEHAGQLYEYRGILWAKRDDQDIWYDFFIVIGDKDLTQEMKYRTEPIDLK